MAPFPPSLHETRQRIGYRHIACALIGLELVVASAFVNPNANAGPLQRRRNANSFELQAARSRPPRVVKTLNDALKDPKLFRAETGRAKSKSGGRTRKKSTNPQQTYVFAAQRKKNAVGDAEDDTSTSRQPEVKNDNLSEAKRMGLVHPGSPEQCCDALVGGTMPRIVAEICLVDPEEADDVVGNTNAFAYVIEKPAGWTIMGGKKERKSDAADDTSENGKGALRKEKRDSPSPVKKRRSDKEEDASEYSMQDILDVLTPEERMELELEGGTEALFFDEADSKATPKFFDDDEDEVAKPSTKSAPTVEVVKQDLPSTLPTGDRPSILAWLKDLKSKQSTPIRGGKYWKALAGATDAHDTGLVLICPKEKLKSLRIHSATYIAIVGSSKKLAVVKNKLTQRPASLDILTKRTHKDSRDIVFTAQAIYNDVPSTCDNVVHAVQTQFMDGVRGDPNADPLDRRSPRRLIHCEHLSLSLAEDPEDAPRVFFSDDKPDDMDVMSSTQYLDKRQFFSTRQQLQDNDDTTAYREINGESDGYPGWIVDRYDQWLLIQNQLRDDARPMPPLPSIHDGKTRGIYILENTTPDRSVMARKAIKPVLFQGEPLKPTKLKSDNLDTPLLPIKENGVTYLVDFDNLSTGIFLDQRPQRAWLKQNCDGDTKVLNCFAHCGGFSIAAAVAGAQTTSLDLEKKWLDRIQPQMEENGIDWSEGRHDAIYGDCFDWLARLAKRGEKYDIVIIDPPSTSVGGKKKKRWSIKNDMDELASLAAPMVKRRGLLWTTNNCASLSPLKFAKLCHKGLEDVHPGGWKLERVVPMPADFPSLGESPVTNLVWRRT